METETKKKRKEKKRKKKGKRQLKNFLGGQVDDFVYHK